MRPPIAGPTAVAVLNIVEFRAMAFVRTGRSTISSTKDWRAGASKAFTTPRQKARTMMCQGATTRRKTSAERMKARSMLRVWVTTRSLRRGNAVRDHPAVEGEEPRRDPGREPHVPEVRLGVRELVDEVPLRRGLHPGAEERGHLPEEP